MAHFQALLDLGERVKVAQCYTLHPEEMDVQLHKTICKTVLTVDAAFLAIYSYGIYHLVSTSHHHFPSRLSSLWCRRDEWGVDRPYKIKVCVASDVCKSLHNQMDL